MMDTLDLFRLLEAHPELEMLHEVASVLRRVLDSLPVTDPNWQYVFDISKAFSTYIDRVARVCGGQE